MPSLSGFEGYFGKYVSVFLLNINVNRLYMATGVSVTIRGRSDGLKDQDVRELYYGKD